MDKQEIFNKIWHHAVVEDMPRSVNENNQCVYRDGRGNMCFVGMVMPDEVHCDRINDMALDGLLDEFLGADTFNAGFKPSQVQKDWAKEMEPHVDFLLDLQQIHDSLGSHQMSRVHLTDFAKRNDLTIPG